MNSTSDYSTLGLVDLHCGMARQDFALSFRNPSAWEGPSLVVSELAEPDMLRRFAMNKRTSAMDCPAYCILRRSSAVACKEFAQPVIVNRLAGA